MNFEWSSSDVATMTLTIYPTNITLNKAASRYFENVSYVMLGIDKEAKKIGIKPITKEDINNNIYPKDRMHRISLGSSYARICNKNFINDLAQFFNLDFEKNQNYKIQVTYDVIHSIMVGSF